MLELAQRLGVTLEMIHYPQETKGKNLLMVGAGCFCRGTWHMVDAVLYYSRLFENVYVLSATFDATFAPVEKLLKELPANVTLFCRERYSYDRVVKLVPNAGKVFIDHDLAFQIDVTKWKKTGRGTLNAFRTDNESLLNRVPRPNFDISSMGREYHHSLILDTLANFEAVNTDRLHVSIAGALLGKKVRVFEGNYHKIKSIYEYSLRDRFPNVTLCGLAELKSLLAASDKTAFRQRLFSWSLRIPRAQYLLRELKKHRLKQAAK